MTRILTTVVGIAGRPIVLLVVARRSPSGTGGAAERGVHRHRPQGQDVERPVGAEGRHRWRRVRAAARAAAVRSSTCRRAGSGRRQRRAVVAGHRAERLRRRDRQGAQRGHVDPRGGPAVRHQQDEIDAFTTNAAVRCAARDRRQPHRRAGHPRPRVVLPAGARVGDRLRSPRRACQLDAFTIQEVTDHGGGTYILDMGRASAAEIRREAEIAEAEARRLSEEKRIHAETEMANYQRALDLRQAEILAETDRAKALSASAGPLEAAARQQEILAQEELVAERQAALTERRAGHHGAPPRGRRAVPARAAGRGAAGHHRQGRRGGQGRERAPRRR